MCGIVGYIGKKEVVPILINGLKRLEYRGYDSAGVAVLTGNGAHSKRVLGRVAGLEDALQGNGWQTATIGIAHTRWATHGKPSEANAHPHTDCKGNIWVAHNGIVENYQELKKALIEAGHEFKSETDTEVLAHLIEAETEKTDNLFNAVRHALSHVRGAYGLAVISATEPDKIIAARNSSPLILGIGPEENLVASDASAIINLTKEVIYLDDNEIAEVTADSFRVESLEFGPHGSEKRVKHPETIEWDEAAIAKDGHAHFMHKEIFEIPEVIRNSIRGRLIVEEGRAKLGGIENHKDELRDVERVLITACGTAHVAGRVAEYMLEEYAGVPTEVDIASEFRYRKPIFGKNDLLLAISQSGETADTLAAVKEAKEKGVTTMGIVNVVGSSISRDTDFGVYNHAGPEISVASTKAFVSQLIVSSLFTLFLGRQREMSLTMGKRIAEELKQLPELVKVVLQQEDAIKAIAAKYKDMPAIMTLGRKYNAPLAAEVAIKFKELCYIPAIDLPAGEMKHGSLALIDKDFPTLAIAPVDSVYEKMKSNIEEIKARVGPIIALTTEGNDELSQYASDVIYIPKTLEMLTPIVAVVPLYLLTYHIAALKGHDIDKPRNLAKSVTVE
ncbi:MAG: glutamine--fructose-6-phosphate transaminase (isomerizing) [Candidatus Harrisonbacteria bacterium CG10_big_fil_rev_8_21_14_0_10_49_15]|uniref:Glutamine--fructose-6-phosphate aminotransferase [isomerizing] n=1 Tax=Candidatus Harrisonbacteria bacterium CG10_big_fil_rev_8_21_14_0_10_49_15 TaxID=1974587 RepID=A0A2H0UKP5_9BACT|nr:MAG: glutamine--fructose-6-phosphate transaminase (isomerizing) [Candidatus Harrisonbacteria bacterium CG10_big_fil_rev_8_21_14_0_10_49_15]